MTGLTTREKEALRLLVGAAEHVDFGGQTFATVAKRVTDRLVRPIIPGASRCSCGAYCGRVDHSGLQIDQVLLILSQVQAFEHLIKRPLTPPAPKLIHR